MINYVDTTSNTCVFGYGSIDISITAQIVIFKEISSPVGAGGRIFNDDGTKFGDWEFTGNRLILTFTTMDEIKTINTLLKEVEERESGSFKFKDITFDFSNYKQESMNLIKTAIEIVKRNILYVMAC